MDNKWKSKLGLFFTSQAISLFGSSLVQFSIIWYITLTTQSGVMTTIATLCGFVPQVLISLFAGVWADKFNKKMLIVLADGAIALVTLIIAILFLTGYNPIWLLFVVLVVRSFGGGIQTPAVSSFIPEIVPHDKLMKANGVNTTIQSIMLILSPAAGGALMANVELEYIFFIDVVTAIIGITLFLFVKYQYKKASDEKVDYFSSIKEGLSYVKNHKLIFRLMMYSMVLNVLVSPLAMLTPLMVTRSFGADPWYLTLNEIVFFVGNIAGGILISAWGGFKNKLHTVGLGCILCGVFAFFMGLPLGFPLYLLWMALCGLTMPLFNTPVITLFQENVDADKLGRVFSLVTVVSGAITPLAIVFFGPMADYLKIEHMIIVTGLLFIVCTICFMKDKVLNSVMNVPKQSPPPET